MTRINLSNLKKKQAKLLLTMLQEADKDRSGWRDSTRYKVNYKTKRVKVSLTNNIIKRKSKRGDVRYDVIDQKELGAGGFGTVYPVQLTLKIMDGALIAKEKPKGKRRVIKVTNLTNTNGQTCLDAVVAEYEASIKTPHLSPKYPVVYNDLIFSVARRQEGQELFELLKEDRHKPLFTLEERFQLTVNLLLALQQQVFAMDLVHRDIKPENIIVDRETMTIGTVDYGFAKIGEQKLERDRLGSKIYAAPEVFYNSGTTRLSDGYSMGRILAILWGNSMISFNPKLSSSQILKHARENDYSSLFKGIPGIKMEAAILIVDTLQKLTAFEPKDRITLEQAIEQILKAQAIQFSSVQDYQQEAFMQVPDRSESREETRSKSLGFFEKNKEKEQAPLIAPLPGRFDPGNQ